MPTTNAKPPSHAQEARLRALLERLVEAYNRERPETWAPWNRRKPTLTGLKTRILDALAYCDGDEAALEQALIGALRGMPTWFRAVYPQGRTGKPLFAALFMANRNEATLGVEAWRLFTWSEELSCRESDRAATIAPKALWTGDGWIIQGNTPVTPAQRDALIAEARARGEGLSEL